MRLCPCLRAVPLLTHALTPPPLSPQAAHAALLPQYHAAVLDVYRTPPGHTGAPVAPAQFINDGYILLSIAHHLLGAGRLQELRELLVNPAWLEVKLHCYGVAALVEDFRRYLQVREGASGPRVGIGHWGGAGRVGACHTGG